MASKHHRLEGVEGRKLSQHLEKCAPYMQEGEDPRIRWRIGMTMFGKLHTPPSYGSCPETAVFLRERSSLVSAVPGWRARMDHSLIYAPSAEWTSTDDDLPDSPQALALQALEDQLGITLADVTGKCRRLLLCQEYQHGATASYRATHYGVFLRTGAAVRRFLDALRLPISAGSLIAVAEGEYNGTSKHTTHLDSEMCDVLDAGFAHIQRK